jgi:hypothetical protein
MIDKLPQCGHVFLNPKFGIPKTFFKNVSKNKKNKKNKNKINKKIFTIKIIKNYRINGHA